MDGRSLARATLAVGFAFGAAACTSGHESAPPPSYSASGETPSSGPSPSETATPAFQPNSIAHLMGQGAIVNIILIEPRHRQEPNEPTLKPAEQEFRTEITSSAPSLLRAIQLSFETATYGRYRPRGVRITQVPDKIAIACMSDDDAKSAAEDAMLQSAASPYNKPGELNIIAVDQQPCGINASGGETGGYDVAGPGEDPVINGRSFNDGTFENTTDHEFGHAGGLNHAGTASCENAVTIEACTLDPTADPLSLMGYTEDDSANRYSYPELAMLGLIHENEVQTITQPGEYTVVTMNHAGKKVLVLTGDDGNPVYLTYEADPTAPYDELCKPDPYINKPYDPLVAASNVLSAGTDGSGNGFVCLSVHHRPLHDSLQVRTPEYATDADSPFGAQSFLADVVRPQRAHNTFDPQVESGEVIPGKVVYQNSSYAVILEHITGNSAVVKVSALQTAGA